MVKNVNKIFVGFDRDGTLETSDLAMSSELKQKIVELEKSGINIFFASGKSIELLKDLASNIGVKPVLLCAENGGHIYDVKNGQELVLGKNADLERFGELIKRVDLPTHKYEHKVSIWSRKFGKHVNEAGRIIDEVIKQHKLELQFFTYPDGDGGLDVVSPGIDKKNLLSFISEDAIIHYIGDSYNDLCLMENERVIPHTVANANDVVKELVARKNGCISSKMAGEGVLSVLCKVFGN